MLPTTVIRTDIRRSRTLSADKIHVIDAEVHVHSGVTLTIADGATVMIVNGVKASTSASRSKPDKALLGGRCALVFDPGSRLRAEKFTVKAADAQFKPQRLADNGGLWFCGSTYPASKDGVTVTGDRLLALSDFQAREVSCSFLGHRDPLNAAATRATDTTAAGNLPSPEAADGDDDSGDDVDGVSVLGVGINEWAITAVRSRFSGDDGFDVTNSVIALDRLLVEQPTEDGLNVSSSRVRIRRRLTIDMGADTGADRELFDLETDDGASYVEISTGCRVDLDGEFGDQVVLCSRDLPQPAAGRYTYSGRSASAASLVYSIDED